MADVDEQVASTLNGGFKQTVIELVKMFKEDTRVVY